MKRLTHCLRNAFGGTLVAGLLCAAPLICHSADGQEVGGDEQVVINGARSPSLASYRIMLAGLDAFDENHALAPTAREVKFWLKPHHDDSGDALTGLKLRIAGDSVTIPVPLNADAEFTLPRNAVAEEEDADMLLNKSKNEYSLEIEVYSDGVPANMRRLGDLRLECEVAIAMAKKEIGFFWNMTINTILLSRDWCMSSKIQIPSYTRQAIDSATLIHGTQRIALKVDKTHHDFEAPVNQKDYADDDLIELQFGAAPTTPPSAQ